MNPKFATSTTYIVGAIIGYFAHARVSFQTRQLSSSRFIVFQFISLLGLIVSYLLMAFLVEFINPYFSQLIVMAIIAASNFFLFSTFVYK
jgi:putative flippase GtrA